MAEDRIFVDRDGRPTTIAGKTVSAGAGDGGKVFVPDSSGRWDMTLMPVGVMAEVKAAVASEALSGGNLVNLWNNAGTLNVRKADATVAGKEADGFVKAAVSSGDTATVYEEGVNTAVSGLTPGTVYWLDTTAGGVTATPPSATGNVVQEIGKATDAGELIFRPSGRGYILG